MTMTRLHIHLISGSSRSRNGGPGASSFIGSFTELGPYYLSEDSLKTESYRWSNKINGWGKGMWMGWILKDEDNLLKGWVDCIIRMILCSWKNTICSHTLMSIYQSYTPRWVIVLNMISLMHCAVSVYAILQVHQKPFLNVFKSEMINEKPLN